MSQNISFYKETIDLSEIESQYNKNQLDFLCKKICTHFEPFKQYFLQQPIAKIVDPKPTFKPTISKNLRDNLKLQRQLMYAKKVITNDYGNKILEECIDDNHYENIQKIKNTSVVHRGYLYWCQQAIINRLKIDSCVQKTINNHSNKDSYSIRKGHPEVILDVHQRINQLKRSKDILYIRTARRIFIYSLINNQIIHQKSTANEIINFQLYDSSKKYSKFLFSTHEQSISSMFSFDNHKDKPILFCKIDGIINSIMPLTISSSIVCKDNAILMIDERCKSINEMHRRLNSKLDRIYSGLSLKYTKFGQRYMLTSQSYSINLYDIRKPHESILKIAHFCEQSPPSILQLFQMSSHQSQINIQTLQQQQSLDKLMQSLMFRKQIDYNCLLIAHSHYQTGSSLLADLNIYFNNQDQKFRKQFKSEVNQFSNKFQLLYNSGFIQSGYHPWSIAPIQLANNLGLFHIDNYYGINLQILSKNNHNKNLKGHKQTKAYNNLYQRVVQMVVQEGVEGLKEPNSQWFSNHQLQIQMQQKNDDFWTNKISQEMDIQLQSNKHQQNSIRFANFKKFYEKLHFKSTDVQMKKLLTQQQESLQKMNKVDKVMKSQQNDNTLTLNNQNHLSFSNLLLSEEDITEILNQWNNIDQ